MRNRYENSRKRYDLPTYLGPKAHGDQMLWMLGEIIQPMQPIYHLIKVSPSVLNYVIQQREFKYIIIMSINIHIINHEMKLMEMGGRE
jgi:hypothetical protein